MSNTITIKQINQSIDMYECIIHSIHSLSSSQH